MTDISMDKKYRTTHGKEVRIYAVDGLRETPTHGAILTSGGWQVTEWESNGKHPMVDDFSLIEVKSRHQRTVWLNIYPDHTVLYNSKTQSEIRRDNSRCIAAIENELDFEEGEGLDTK